MRPWRDAWAQALYGPDGFYRRERPARHFRTASHAAAPALAGAIGELVRRHRLGRVVEVGCGDGELLAALAGHGVPGGPAGAARSGVEPTGVELIGVEIRPRPAGLPAAVHWHTDLPALDQVPTLLLGWELLDVQPATVALADGVGGWREVCVDPAGHECTGDPLAPADLAWCRDWAPDAPAGTRIEVNLARETFWQNLLRRLPCGVAVAVDYGVHVPADTLTGFRDGRQVRPVPDGSCDLTAHLHWPGLLAAVGSVGPTTLTDQHAILTDLGLRPERPQGHLAVTDGPGYLTALQRYSAEQELIDPAGLGAFGWLCTQVG